MNDRSKLAVIGMLLGTACTPLCAGESRPNPSNGAQYPTGWQHWQALSVSHRGDNGTLRVILRNEVAVEAALKGTTNPWPNGTMLGKVV